MKNGCTLVAIHCGTVCIWIFSNASTIELLLEKCVTYLKYYICLVLFIFFPETQNSQDQTNLSAPTNQSSSTSALQQNGSKSQLLRPQRSLHQRRFSEVNLYFIKLDQFYCILFHIFFCVENKRCTCNKSIKHINLFSVYSALGNGFPFVERLAAWASWLTVRAPEKHYPTHCTYVQVLSR